MNILEKSTEVKLYLENCLGYYQGLLSNKHWQYDFLKEVYNLHFSICHRLLDL